MNDYIFCVSTKDPEEECLFKNISLLNKHYNKPEIHIIDSKSEQTLGYNSIKEFDNVKTHYADNVNYELGAWRYAVDNIPAENYICIQDSLFIEKKIDFNFSEADVYSFNLYWGWFSCFDESYLIEMYEKAINFLTKDTVYYDQCWQSWIDRDKQFNLITHNSFGCKGSILRDIFSNFKNLPTNKIHSCATERLMYWVFSHHTSKIVPINNINVYDGDKTEIIWNKIHGHRQ